MHISTVGQAYDLLKDSLRAICDYDSVLMFDTGYTDAYYFRGLDYMKIHAAQDAVDDFIELVKTDTNAYYDYYLLGMAYDSLGDYENAVINLTKAIDMTDNFGQAYFGRDMLIYKTEISKWPAATLTQLITTE